MPDLKALGDGKGRLSKKASKDDFLFHLESFFTGSDDAGIPIQLLVEELPAKFVYRWCGLSDMGVINVPEWLFLLLKDFFHRFLPFAGQGILLFFLLPGTFYF